MGAPEIPIPNYLQARQISDSNRSLVIRDTANEYLVRKIGTFLWIHPTTEIAPREFLLRDLFYARL
jgi:hypothetical protein